MSLFSTLAHYTIGIFGDVVHRSTKKEAVTPEGRHRLGLISG